MSGSPRTGDDDGSMSASPRTGDNSRSGSNGVVVPFSSGSLRESGGNRRGFGLGGGEF